jgi:hypothetical protein
VHRHQFHSAKLDFSAFFSITASFSLTSHSSRISLCQQTLSTEGRAEIRDEIVQRKSQVFSRYFAIFKLLFALLRVQRAMEDEVEALKAIT